MKLILSYMFALLLILPISYAADYDVDPAESSIQEFNQAVESWKQLQEELQSLPSGYLQDATHLGEYAERMHKLLLEMHTATADLPLSETTKVCLDYALHQGCDLCTCTAECCQKAKEGNRMVSETEVNLLEAKAEKSGCECTLPIRLAIRHDLHKIGVSDQETIDMILMIPKGAEYQGLSSIDWKKVAPKKE